MQEPPHEPIDVKQMTRDLIARLEQRKAEKQAGAVNGDGAGIIRDQIAETSATSTTCAGSRDPGVTPDPRSHGPSGWPSRIVYGFQVRRITPGGSARA